MQKRSLVFVFGVAALVAVGISSSLHQRGAEGGLGARTSYLVAESDGYDESYDSAPTEDTGSTNTESGTESGSTNDDYMSEDF